MKHRNVKLQNLKLAVFLLVICWVTGCDVESGNTSFFAPEGLTYNVPSVTSVGTQLEIKPYLAHGGLLNFSVSPALPAGLVLDPETGIISGAPTTK